MAVRAHKPVTVSLGPKTDRVQQYVREGRYGSVSEVLRAGVEALEQQDAVLEGVLKATVAEVLADPRPFVPLDEAMARVHARIDGQR